MIWLNLGAAILGGLAMTASVADPASLEGKWGGDRLRLVVDAGGATFTTDCASGRVAGPIKLSPAGTFASTGTFEQHQGGPQPADTQAKQSAARFSGQIKGDDMTLSILPEGATTAQTFSLRKGATVKLVRCL